MRMIVATMATLLACGCARPQQSSILSVSEVVARHTELNGKIVQVRGWLDECRGRSCALMQSPNATYKESLSIGSGSAIDGQDLGFSEIILEARIRSVCFNDPMPPGVVEVCVDRVDQLQPLQVIQVLTKGKPN